MEPITGNGVEEDPQHPLTKCQGIPQGSCKDRARMVKERQLRLGFVIIIWSLIGDVD